MASRHPRRVANSLERTVQMVDMAMQFSQDERDLAAGGVLTIDLAALRHNYSAIARHIAPTRAAAVVKADAYGLGASRVAPRVLRCRLP